jgi:hypothetical protein
MPKASPRVFLIAETRALASFSLPSDFWKARAAKHRPVRGSPLIRPAQGCAGRAKPVQKTKPVQSRSKQSRCKAGVALVCRAPLGLSPSGIIASESPGASWANQPERRWRHFFILGSQSRPGPGRRPGRSDSDNHGIIGPTSAAKRKATEYVLSLLVLITLAAAPAGTPRQV